MEGPPLGPGGEDITWPDQVAPRGRKASSTRKIKPQTSNLKPQTQDHRVRVREIRQEPPSLVRAEGVATVVAHHPAAVAVDVEKETIVWIRSQVQTRCLMRIESTSKML